jgi:hypothetical protein
LTGSIRTKVIPGLREAFRLEEEGGHSGLVDSF